LPVPLKALFLILPAAFLLPGCEHEAVEEQSFQPSAGFVGVESCAECHDEQFAAWRGSHHDLSMQVATADSVLGDIDTRAGRIWMRADDAQGELRDFEVEYTFGVTPLQQYLTELPGGRLQVLPLSWDSRPVESGGQRWFRMYGEAIPHSDSLHWTRREQNWNHMCAECHSTGLQKNYDAATDTFDTSWAEIDVACEACHGPGSEHARNPEIELPVDLDDRGTAVWQMNPSTGIAERSVAATSLVQPEACGRCHSRRSVITAEYEYGRPLTDTHLPSLLEDGLYYPDGQIREEVYVYGSFLQSRMYRAGVTCSDCHDPHTVRLRTDGNPSAVCATCHLPTTFASTEHHHHEVAAVECVDCHMPATTYMVVDPRRDHGFRAPRPELTATTGSPNACNGCHRDESPEWAADAVKAWYGEPERNGAHFAEAIHAGRTRQAGANAALVEVINDEHNARIVRATALTLLARPFSDDSRVAIRRGLSSLDPLIRIGALRALEGIDTDFRGQWAAPLLADPIRAVRIQAVTTLAPSRANLRQANHAAFRSAEQEYVSAQLANAERPEAHINLGNLYARLGEADRAERSYRRALRSEPRAVAARVNLADLHRQLSRDDDAERLLRAGLELDDASPALHHALGLTLVRGDRLDAALAELGRAVELDEDDARYVYVYAVAVNSLGEPQRAVGILENARRRFPGDYDIAWALATMYRDAGRIDDAKTTAQALLEQFPGDQNSRLLLDSL
jgi:tetratricopeptide (TPR) repeat protein